MPTDPPLILFSGMGADKRVFAPQAAAFPGLVVPRWIAPLAAESLAGYAGRLAKEIDPARPCFVGGASFGGMVALEVARHLPHVLGCFLIGSVRSPRELPARVRALRPLGRFARCLPFACLPLSARMTLAMKDHPMLRQAADADPTFLRWACRAVLTWEPPAGRPAFPVHQIHGERDPILPCRCTRPDVVVGGAGHVLSLSHPEQVNQFIRERIRAEITDCGRSDGPGERYRAIQ
jgi:pimeloyl-ACP methyl ester carboxylesterase